MLSQYETTETTNTQDLFDLTSDYNETIDNTQASNQQQQQQQQTVPPPVQAPVQATQSQPTIATVASTTAINPILNQNQSTTIYPGQPTRLTYIPQARPQSTSYQTPNLQRIQTMPATSTIVRATNVISNGIQQQATVYTSSQQQQQPLINPSAGVPRPLYQRMPTATGQHPMSSAIVRQQYSNPAMININQNVPQMSIVKVRWHSRSDWTERTYASPSL